LSESLYGYLNHIRSSRRLELETKRNIELMWLVRKLNPDFKTIADFRKDNKKALVQVFRDFTQLCSNWQLFGKELVAIDGSNKLIFLQAFPKLTDLMTKV